MKDRCKLFCLVAGTTAYYQLKDRVIDGTPCGPDTYDICVQGLCRVYLPVYSFIMNLHIHTATREHTHTPASTSTSSLVLTYPNAFMMSCLSLLDLCSIITGKGVSSESQSATITKTCICQICVVQVKY